MTFKIDDKVKIIGNSLSAAVHTVGCIGIVSGVDRIDDHGIVSVDVADQEWAFRLRDLELLTACIECPDVKSHSHYFKSVAHLDYIDIYQVCSLFGVDDPGGCIQHSIKKLLMAGKRGGGKSFDKDIQEAIATLERLQQMRSQPPKEDK